MSCHDSTLPTEYGTPRYYYHGASGMLLDVNEGVFKYDASTYTMILVKPLRRREQRVLTCLSSHENQLVTNSKLLAQGWMGRIVGKQSLNVAIYNLRKVLQMIDPDGHSLTTVRGVGVAFSPQCAGMAPISSLGYLLTCLRWEHWASIPHTPLANKP